MAKAFDATTEKSLEGILICLIHQGAAVKSENKHLKPRAVLKTHTQTKGLDWQEGPEGGYTFLQMGGKRGRGLIPSSWDRVLLNHSQTRLCM